MATVKICRQCDELKPLAEFYHYANGSPLHVCKNCHKDRMKLNRLTRVQERERQRAKTTEISERLRRNVSRWRQRYPEGYRAHNAANNAVRVGKLTRQPCQICATTTNVHKHHRDYSRPLEVIWLCARCHSRAHALFPELKAHDQKP
jgi:hypothetical protein